jgi:ribosomal protein S18 acetylase RimI-like enzyme
MELHQRPTVVTFSRSPQVRRLQRDDVAQVTAILSILPDLYPGGDEWLNRRLIDALEGRARCTLLAVDKQLAGVAIETPKGAGRLKLSTFYVADEFRNGGHGGSLIRVLRDQWVADRLAEVYLTVAEQNHEQLRRVFEPVGFLTLTCENDRYGTDRNEYVMTCLPSSDGCS